MSFWNFIQLRTHAQIIHGSPDNSLWPSCLVTFVRVVVSDVMDGISHHLLVVYAGAGCDLSTEQHHASLAHRLCFRPG